MQRSIARRGGEQLSCVVSLTARVVLPRGSPGDALPAMTRSGLSWKAVQALPPGELQDTRKRDSALLPLQSLDDRLPYVISSAGRTKRHENRVAESCAFFVRSGA